MSIWFKRSKAKTVDVYEDLRSSALSVSASDVGVSPRPGRERYWGVVLEMRHSAGVVTLVCLADGTTSLYLSTGGAVLGAGVHQEVRSASQRLINVANASTAELVVARRTPRPSTGRVTVYLKGFDYLFTAEASERALIAGNHELSPLYGAAHEVISAIRERDGRAAS